MLKGWKCVAVTKESIARSQSQLCRISTNVKPERIWRIHSEFGKEEVLKTLIRTIWEKWCGGKTDCSDIPHCQESSQVKTLQDLLNWGEEKVTVWHFFFQWCFLPKESCKRIFFYDASIFEQRHINKTLRIQEWCPWENKMSTNDFNSSLGGKTIFPMEVSGEAAWM